MTQGPCGENIAAKQGNTRPEFAVLHHSLLVLHRQLVLHISLVLYLAQEITRAKAMPDISGLSGTSSVCLVVTCV